LPASDRAARRPAAAALGDPYDQLLRRRDARTDTASTSSDPPTPIAATSLRSPSRPPTTPRKPSDGHSHRPHDQRGVPTEQLSRRCPPRPGDPAALTSIDTACRELRLPSIRSRVEDMIAAAEREQLGYARFLAEALLAECDDRDERRRTRRVHDAAFPRTKRLEDFDHTANGRRSMLGPAPRIPGR
jgi:hypothetical protein